MVFVRKVRTGSGAMAVQIAERKHGRDKVLKHFGSAHTEGELALLVQVAHDEINKNQGVLDVNIGAGETTAILTG